MVYQSNSTSIFDRLAFRGTAMCLAGGWSAPSVSATHVSIPLPGGNKDFTSLVPFYSNQSAIRADHAQWPELCAIFRRLGLPVVGSIADFEKLPAAAIPIRIGRRFAQERLDPNEITTADIFEFLCRAAVTSGTAAAQAKVPTLPLEIDRPQRLRSLVSLLRDLSGSDIPIGAAVGLSVCREDIVALIDSGVDFLTLESTNDHGIGESDYSYWFVSQLSRIRTMCVALDQPRFPLVVECPFSSADWVIKTLALGASIVCIDGIVNAIQAELRRHQPAVHGKGLLAGIADAYAAPTKSFIESVHDALNNLINQLHLQMSLAGCQSLPHFDVSCLASYDEQVCRLTRATLLDIGDFTS